MRPGWRVGGEGDRLARELLELADQVAFLAVPVAVGLVEVGTQVAVAGPGVGQQVPDDGQDRVADRTQGALLATTSGDAAVALAAEGAGAPGRDGDLGRGWRPATGCPCRWPPPWPCRLRCWLGERTSPTPPGARRSGRRPRPHRARPVSCWAQTSPMPVTASGWATRAANGATWSWIRAVSSSMRSSIITPL
jgi:hypothetical protein